MIKVAIADDHPMVIQGIENMLAGMKNIKVIATYTNAAGLLSGLKSGTPDVLLLDIHLPDQAGDMITPALLNAYPTLKILVLTNADSPLYVRTMLRLGVHGYALKTIAPAQLAEAIQHVYEGKNYIDTSLKEKIDNSQLRNKRETFLKAQLTERELEVLQLVTEGYTAQEISEKLFVSIKTIEYYRINLLLKLDAKNTAILVRKALEAGLVK